MDSNDKWVVLFLSAAEGYGIAQRRVSMLELTCRGMTMERAQEICGQLNAREKSTRQRA